MSIYRRAAKVDATQASIVKSLESIGVEVYPIRLPCDLLLHFWCNRHQTFCWQTLEVKSPTRKDGSSRVRKDRDTQTAFLLNTHTPTATSFDEAWEKLNKQHALGRADTMGAIS